MTTLIIIYIAYCILNYIDAHQLNTFNTPWQKIYLIISGFFCTPASIMLLIKLALSKKDVDAFIYSEAHVKYFELKQWLFSIAFNTLMFFILT